MTKDGAAVIRRGATRLCAATLLWVGVLGLAALPAGAALLTDPSNGVAIFGFDPVSYRLDGAARSGSPDCVAQVESVIWRFTSDANRAAFLDDPASYAPRLGGYDGAGLSRGFVAAGDPEIFAVVDGGLYFFRSAENRDAFISDAALRTGADRRWTALHGRVIP